MALKKKIYEGIDNDPSNGMSDTGRIIRDAWAFGLLPETETCKGWNDQRISALWEQTQEEWRKYDYKVGGLPEDILERYMRIQKSWIERAKEKGWDPSIDPNDE